MQCITTDCRYNTIHGECELPVKKCPLGVLKPIMEKEKQTQYLYCSQCGKVVSNAKLVLNKPGKIVIRAWIECPECLEKK